MYDNFINEKNSLYQCDYIISFCPKYKRKIFDNKDIIKFLTKTFKNIEKEYNFQIIKLKIEPNQVIMNVRCNPTFGINKVVTKLKDISAKELKNEFPSLEKRVPCIWTRDTFIQTIGSLDEQALEYFFKIQEKYNQKGD